MDAEIAAALQQEWPFAALWEVAKARRDAGRSREELMDDMSALRAELVAAGREADEDVVLEVMDCLSGHVSPHLKL